MFIGVIARIGFTMIFVWLLIYFIAGSNNHDLREISIWSVFMVFFGYADRFMMLVSTAPGFILGVKIVFALLVGVLLYVLFDYRIGIEDRKKRLTIAGIYVGTKLLFQLVL
jgi:hypothetical protein